MCCTSYDILTSILVTLFPPALLVDTEREESGFQDLETMDSGLPGKPDL